MPRILFQCLHRPDRSPSQRYRFEQYLPFFKENGYDFTYSYLLNEKDDKGFYRKGAYLRKAWILLKSLIIRMGEISVAHRYDIVFVQRESFMLGTAFFEKAMAKRSKLIYDFDDSIWLHAVSNNNRSLGFLKNADKTKEIIKAAYTIIAGNEYLAQYARQYNKAVWVIPTTINVQSYSTIATKKPGDRVCIGWTGSFTTIEHFEHMLPAFIKLKEKFGNDIYFKIIGDPQYTNDVLQVKGIAWNKETESTDLDEIDIGVMPLPDTDWARGKCGLKGLQYMAKGIATVMSPVGVNSIIIEDGVNGFLANDENEWVSKISMLIDNPALRQQLGAAGRNTVEQKYSVDANKELYLNIFKKV